MWLFLASRARAPLSSRAYIPVRAFCTVNSSQKDVGSKAFRYDPGPAVFGSSLFWAERRQERYKELLSRLRLQHPRHLITNGVQIDLPHRSIRPPLIDSDAEGVSDQMLQNMASFFGEFGYISFESSRNSITIALAQIYTNGERLLQFQQIFGGILRCRSSQNGGILARTSLEFRGKEAVRLADVLSKFPSSKSQQLQLVVSWHRGRQQIREMWPLVEAARARETCGAFRSVQSFAGFFDHRGQVHIHKYGYVHVRIYIPPSTNEQLTQEFLQLHKCVGTILRAANGCTYFTFTKSIGLSLLRLVQPYLVNKKKLVDAILLCHDDEKALFEMRNKNSAYWIDRKTARVDLKAVALGRRLRSLKASVYKRKAQNRSVPPSFEEQIQVLLRERHDHKAEVFANNIRLKIRNLLDRGAHVVPKQSCVLK